MKIYKMNKAKKKNRKRINKYFINRCRFVRDEINGDGDCDYDTDILCEECKYSGGKKDPEAKCNQY